jgi:hypothetical protein
MKTGFKDPIAPRQVVPKGIPYDERTGFFVSQGTNYGVGFNQPVGSDAPGTLRAPTLPFGDVSTMRTDEGR